MRREIVDWANQFYFTSLKIEAKNTSLPETVETDFEEYFRYPMSQLFGKEEIDTAELKLLADTATRVGLPNPLHHVEALLDYLNDQRDVQERLVEAMKALLEDNTVAYFCMVGGKPFKALARDSRPYVAYLRSLNPVYLVDAKYLKRQLNLGQLAKADAYELPDYALQCLRNAVNGGILREATLQSTKHWIVDKNNILCESTVNAMTEELPSYHVRRAVSMMPTAILNDAISPYHATLDYVVEHKADYNEKMISELQWLASCPLSGESIKSVPSDAIPTEEQVLRYLQVKLGISAEHVSDVIHPSAQTLYTSALLLTEEQKNMSTEEFVEMVNAGEAPTGTLADLVEAQCAEAKFNMECSVNQFIEFMNADEDIEPPIPQPKQVTLKQVIDVIKNSPQFDEDVRDMVIGALRGQRMAEFPQHEDMVDAVRSMLLNGKLTDSEKEDLFEAVDSIREEATVATVAPTPEITPEVLQSKVISLIRESSQIEQKLADDVIAALTENKPVKYPDAMSVLANIEAADLFDVAVHKAEQSNVTLKFPKQPVQAEDVEDFLVRTGMTRAEAAAMVAGNHVAADIAPPAFELDDNAYKAARTLLYRLRTKIAEEGIQSCGEYTYMVFCMLGNIVPYIDKHRDRVLETLHKKMEELPPEYAAWLQEAADTL